VHAEERAMRITFVYWEITVAIYSKLFSEEYGKRGEKRKVLLLAQ
jgi:hypothetical protein